MTNTGGGRVAMRVAAIGECMAEVRLPPAAGGHAGAALDATIAFGGDTLNFAVYLARQGIAVDYVTALGDDPLSDWMLAEWRRERVGCDFVRREAGAATGLYLIDVDTAGETSFHYWRAHSPASRLLDDAARAQRLFARLADRAWLYVSGITLAIYTPESRTRLLDCASAFRRGGGKVAFDGNFRARLWTDAAEARATYERMYRLTDLALSTFDDEQQVFGDATVDAAADRLQGWGVPEVVLKRGAAGCTVAAGATRLTVPAVPVAAVVDTTAAGDSFNAGYLAARIEGGSVAAAAARGAQVAAKVVQHPGAIVPADGR